MMESYFETVGRVVSKEKDYLSIETSPSSACQSCSIKGSCLSLSESKRVFTIKNSQYNLGDQVKLKVQKKSSYLALWWSYIFPACLLLSVIWGGVQITTQEVVLAFSALAILCLYYALLYLFYHPTAVQNCFMIEKIGHH